MQVMMTAVRRGVVAAVVAGACFGPLPDLHAAVLVAQSGAASAVPHPLTNLELTLLDKRGVTLDRLGDCTGKVDLSEPTGHCDQRERYWSGK